MPEVHRGSCLCGQVAHVVRGPPRPVVASHCRQCRKTSVRHVAATSAHRGAAENSGEPRWHESSGVARRGAGGSDLFWAGPGENLSILAGTPGCPAGPGVVGHIDRGRQGRPLRDRLWIAQGGPPRPQADDDDQGRSEAAPSGFRGATLLSIPSGAERPPRLPAPVTRWHGIRTAIGTAPRDWPAAWTEMPGAFALSPQGISRNASRN